MAGWKTFLADYFAAAAPARTYHHARLSTVFEESATDDEGQTHRIESQISSLRSGELASLVRRGFGGELALLAHPRRSIVARRAAPGEPWELEGGSGRTPDQFHRNVLHRMDDHDLAIRAAFESPSGSRGTSEQKVVERQFGPIAEEEFDPDHFLDGPQVKEAPPSPMSTNPRGSGAGTGCRCRSAARPDRGRNCLYALRRSALQSVGSPPTECPATRG